MSPSGLLSSEQADFRSIRARVEKIVLRLTGINSNDGGSKLQPPNKQ